MISDSQLFPLREPGIPINWGIPTSTEQCVIWINKRLLWCFLWCFCHIWNTHVQFFHIASRFSFTNVSEYFLQIPPGIPTMQYIPNGSSRHPHGNMKKGLVDVIYIVVNQYLKETDLSRFGLNTHSLSSFYDVIIRMVFTLAASFFGHQINRLSLVSIITKIWEKKLSLQNFNWLQVEEFLKGNSVSKTNLLSWPHIVIFTPLDCSLEAPLSSFGQTFTQLEPWRLGSQAEEVCWTLYSLYTVATCHSRMQDACNLSRW